MAALFFINIYNEMNSLNLKNPVIPMPPVHHVACTQNEWFNQNRSNLEWYYQNYPQLIARGISLPASMDKLKAFYIIDMADRHLTPLAEYLNCYEYLFSYLLSRIDGTVVFRSQSWIEMSILNLPGAFNKTMESITNPFGIPLYVWLVGGVAVYFAINKL